MDREAEPTCTSCGSGAVERLRSRSAFWHGERLVVVDDIPTLVCGTCGEQFYEDRTIVVLDLLRGNGFDHQSALGELRVPVFSFPAGDDPPPEP